MMHKNISAPTAEAEQALQALRKRLLDVSARNGLLNYKHPKNAVLRFVDVAPDAIVTSLRDEIAISFKEVHEPTAQQLVGNGPGEPDKTSSNGNKRPSKLGAVEWAKREGLPHDYGALFSSAASSGDSTLQTVLYREDLDASLASLYSKSFTSIQETGSNILYLAIGFLEWSDTKDTSTTRQAPLYLVPVQLARTIVKTKGARTHTYTLVPTGQGVVPNLSLREKLRIDFGLELPNVTDETMPTAYLDEVKALLEHQPHWKLHTFVSLGLFNFSKLLMYLDLDPQRWPSEQNILDHPVIHRVLTGYGSSRDEDAPALPSSGFSSERDIDRLDTKKYPLIFDADSSQHSALIDAIDGKDLVIEGPPGTGKSQTITNLIAAAMSEGKTVLFVAEKLAALEVVKERLDEAGLGDFCFELHSHQANKRSLLDSFQRRYDNSRKYTDVTAKLDSNLEEYHRRRTELNKHAQRINRVWKNTEKSPYEVFVGAVRARTGLSVAPEDVHLDSLDGETHTPSKHLDLTDLVSSYAQTTQSISEHLAPGSSIVDHPWWGIHGGSLQGFDKRRLDGALLDWQSAIERLRSAWEYTNLALGAPNITSKGSLDEVQELSEALARTPRFDGNENLHDLEILQGEVRTSATLYLSEFEKIQREYVQLAETIPSAALQSLATVDVYLRAQKILDLYIEPDLTLADVKRAIAGSELLLERLAEIAKWMPWFYKALGPSTSEHISLSERGLTQLRDIIQIVNRLDADLCERRGQFLDNPQLDPLIITFCSEVDEITKVGTLLEGYVLPQRLGPPNELGPILEVALKGGSFRWLSSDWRKAKAQLLTYAASPNIKLKDITAHAESIKTYVALRSALLENQAYRNVFQVAWNGLDTDTGALKSLREWYSDVRGKYGSGFSPQAAIANSILTMSSKDVREVRALAARGFLDLIEDILAELTSLRAVLTRTDGLQNIDSSLAGDSGLIAPLHAELSAAHRTLSCLTTDENVSQTTLRATVERLDALRADVGNWNESDRVRAFGGEGYGLTTGIDNDCTEGVESLRATIKMAAYLEQTPGVERIADFIYKNPLESSFSVLAKYRESLHAAVEAEQQSRAEFSGLVGLDFAAWVSKSPRTLDGLIDRNAMALNSDTDLHRWLSYMGARSRLVALGVSQLPKLVEEAKLPCEEIPTAFQAAIFDQLSREILIEMPDLQSFSSNLQNTSREKFIISDLSLRMNQRSHIAYKIAQNHIPEGNNYGKVSDKTELSLLLHESTKKTRHIPVRQLLTRAGNALLALKPCFMMGPMSVAQYLPPGKLHFDLIVMDEASQIRPEDALGAIARGSQLVVVGDPKQLPPTNFFHRVIEEEEDADTSGIEESESILDAALPMFPARRLRWHYRSRHQDLIAFSNESFYDNNLILFPSPELDSKEYGIAFTRVDAGTFNNRTNEAEARAVALAVQRHFRESPQDTIGVVSMNATQQDHIQAAVDALAQNDPDFHDALQVDDSRRESLFIKNLENVQGDERDVILISLTYGPKAPNGIVYQRFGPINSDVGWRRLNVLLTRSKKRMHIYSSMGSDDIQIKAEGKKGVAALRNLLAFCETGILHKTDIASGKPPDSDFEISVIDALRTEGFECVPQVGVSGYFIDLAVKDPNSPGRFLMGIECDGATYHSSKSARDRDRLRQSVLEGLGWRIRRIWSTDWFRSPEQEIERIVLELKSLATPPSYEAEQP